MLPIRTADIRQPHKPLMTPASIGLLALAMSTDAFAAAVAKGAALLRPSWREALRAGCIFGSIEALTSVIGWLLGSFAAKYIADWDHWIAFTLLAVLGARMIWAGARPFEDIAHAKPERHSLWVLATTGFATSIDAMAAGASLAFVKVDIVPVAGAIGMATFTMVTLGMLLGRVLGAVAGKRAEIAGGLVLVGIGAAILYEHLGGR